MKTLLIIGLAALLATAVTGCKTTSNPSGVVSIGNQQIDPLATGKAVRIAAKLGALEVIRSKPETRQYFVLSQAALSANIAAGTYDPSSIKSTLANVTGNTTATETIADALDLYQDFFGKLVADKLDGQSPYTVPALTGLAAGIQDALDLTQ